VPSPLSRLHRTTREQADRVSLVVRIRTAAVEAPVERDSGYGRPARYGQMRSSAAEREHTIDVLKTAFAEGRLTRQECDDRIGLALSPLTYAELAALTRDLPAGQIGLLSQPGLPSRPAGYRAPPASRSASRPLNRTAVASLACAALPVLPLLPVLLGLIAHGQIRERGERGAGLATAGIVLGVFFSLLFIAIVLRRG